MSYSKQQYISNKLNQIIELGIKRNVLMRITLRNVFKREMVVILVEYGTI